MTIFTQKQREIIATNKIKVGSTCQCPTSGFFAYTDPLDVEGTYIDCNPFTRSLAHERLEVKELKYGRYRVNFVKRPKRDFWIDEFELEMRDPYLIIFLMILCFIPCAIYNLFTLDSK